MWLNDVNNLCIYKSRYINILTRFKDEKINELEEIQERKCALNHHDCQNFLISKSSTFEILKVQGDVKEDPMKLEYLQLKVKSFKNIKKLIFYQMILTDEDLQVIGQNCPQLKSLHIIKCFCEHFQALMPGVNINIAEICNIQQLQELEIQPGKAPGYERLLKFKYLQQILNKLHNLKHLNLKGFTIFCTDQEKTDQAFLPSTSWSLEFVHLGIITYDFWCTFTGFLKCLPHLRALSIHTTDDKNIIVNFKLIDILHIYCPKLEILKLRNCEIDVENFCHLSALQEMTLNSCHGLTFNNLQQILGGLSLKVFKLLHTRVYDTQNFIYISQTLESVTIDTVHFSEISQMFQRSLNEFSRLRTLDWLNGDICHNWLLYKCPQLEQLHIASSYHLRRVFLSLKSLKVLTITSITCLSWSLIRNLLFKLSLKHLNIYSTNIVLEDHKNPTKYYVMPTTLEFLAIPWKIFLMHLKYWLELLDINEHLALMIIGSAENILNAKFICLLLATDCVQKRLNRIKICGFKLELENAQNSTILREIAYASINTNHYKETNRTFTLEL